MLFTNGKRRHAHLASSDTVYELYEILRRKNVKIVENNEDETRRSGLEYG